MSAEKLIKYLLNENPKYSKVRIPTSENEQFRIYRSLVNVRPADEISAEYLAAEDEYLRQKTAEKGITDIADLSPVEDDIYLWRGDITTLKCGAIVNAANSGMTGCYQPCHNCIDNCIHTFAGIRLRLNCSETRPPFGSFSFSQPPFSSFRRTSPPEKDRSSRYGFLLFS